MSTMARVDSYMSQIAITLKYDKIHICHMSPIFHSISIYLPNIETAYLTRICNVIVKRLTDKHYTFDTGHLGNHRIVSSGVCMIRISYNARRAHMDVVLPSHVRYERRFDRLFEIQNVSGSYFG
jgi:hypothetical protein